MEENLDAFDFLRLKLNTYPNHLKILRLEAVYIHNDRRYTIVVLTSHKQTGSTLVVIGFYENALAPKQLSANVDTRGTNLFDPQQMGATKI